MEAIYARPHDYDLEHEGDGEQVDRYVSDLDCHVYYPREVELLFRSTGFATEAVYGDYSMRTMRRSSRHMIFVGRRRTRMEGCWRRGGGARTGSTSLSGIAG
jgi:hypothetical protein